MVWLDPSGQKRGRKVAPPERGGMLSAGRHEMYIPFCPATAVHLHSALGHSELGKAAQTLPSGVCGPGLAGDRPSAAHHHQPGAGPPWSGAGRIRNVHSGGLVFACDVCVMRSGYTRRTCVLAVSMYMRPTLVSNEHPPFGPQPLARKVLIWTVSYPWMYLWTPDVLMSFLGYHQMPLAPGPFFQEQLPAHLAMPPERSLNDGRAMVDHRQAVTSLASQPLPGSSVVPTLPQFGTPV